MVNAGYELQDGVHLYDFGAARAEAGGRLARVSRIRTSLLRAFGGGSPRSEPHPVVAIVACMDSRVDTVDLVGDTRKYYYVLRSAGSVMGAQEEDMLELAVANGVKVIVLTTHSDCAAERIASDPASRKLYPNLAAAVDEREQRVNEFLARPMIAEKIRRGELHRPTRPPRHGDRGARPGALTKKPPFESDA